MPFNLRKLFQRFSTAWQNRRAIVRVLQGIKIAVESKQAIDVTNAIPGEWDNRLRDILEKYLPVVIRSIGILGNATDNQQGSEPTYAAIERMKEWNNRKVVGSRLNDIGAQIYILMHNGKNMAKAGELIEETYQEMKANGELSA